MEWNKKIDNVSIVLLSINLRKLQWNEALDAEATHNKKTFGSLRKPSSEKVKTVGVDENWETHFGW